MHSETNQDPAVNAPKAVEPTPGEDRSANDHDAIAAGASAIVCVAERSAVPAAKRVDPRAARLAAALKANIGRRKAAARTAASGDDEK